LSNATANQQDGILGPLHFRSKDKEKCGFLTLKKKNTVARFAKASSPE
jgi:hypothetical protein